MLVDHIQPPPTRFYEWELRCFVQVELSPASGYGSLRWNRRALLCGYLFPWTTILQELRDTCHGYAPAHGHFECTSFRHRTHGGACCAQDIAHFRCCVDLSIHSPPWNARPGVPGRACSLSLIWS